VLAVVARLGRRLLGCAVAIFAAHAIIALALALASGHPLGLDGVYVDSAPRSCTCSAVWWRGRSARLGSNPAGGLTAGRMPKNRPEQETT
jgi:hypothetical protein